jgi:hypothetical protein
VRTANYSKITAVTPCQIKEVRHPAFISSNDDWKIKDIFEKLEWEKIMSERE